MYNPFQKFIAIILLLSMALQSCTSNLKLDTGAAASQPQASKKSLRRLVGKEQHPQDKPMSISASTEKAPASPAAAQVAPTASLFTDLSPSSSSHHTAVLLSPRTILHNQRLSQGTAIPQPLKDCPKAQAMRSVQPIRRPSAPLAKAEVACAAPAQHLTASGGQSIRLSPREGHWQAQVTERIGHAQRQVVLPVVCAPDCQVAALLRYEAGRVAQLLHVAKQGLDEFVYLGRQGLLGGMMQGKEAFPQEQRVPRGSLPKLGPLEHQGPTALELAQKEGTALKKVIKEQYGLLLSQDKERADPQLVGDLLANLEQLLGLEALWTLEESEDSAQEYLVRLRNDEGLPLYGTEVRERVMVLLERAYAQALKGAVSTSLLKGLSNLSHEEQERLAAALGQLAAFHQEQGSQTGDLSLYTDAAILYQHMLQVCEGEGEEIYKGLAEMKESMIARCRQESNVASRRVSPEELRAEIARDKKELQTLREEAKRRVAELEGTEINNETFYIEESKALFAKIAQKVGAFLGSLYQESEDALGAAPCKYTVMGLGSMALQQMTPYSDLEFAILMEDNESQEVLEEHRAYFRELSHLVHLRVINLGETVLPQDQYKAQHKLRISLDHLGKRGINFDLGGKTPLGRKDKPYLKKPYELIQPVAGMMCYLKNEGHKMEHMDKLLPFILERTCYVHGDPGLHAAYVAQKSAFFAKTQTEQGVPVYQARALQKLLEGVVEMNYNKPDPGIAKPSHQGDLADFEPKFADGDAGRLYDVKQEIYRLPDRLLYRLAMYYGLLPESGWDAVAQLSKRGIITREAVQHLGYAVSFATMLRLKTYLHQGQQGESMTVLGGMSQEAAQQFFVLSQEALQEGGSLFQYYYTALPLHKKMEAFFKGREGDFPPIQEENFFQEESFYDDSYSVRGDIHRRVMQHAAAKRCYKKVLEMRQALYPFNHPDVADSLNNVGLAYDTLGEAKKGLGYQEQALEMYRAFYPGNHPSVAASLNNVGSAYETLGEAKKGLGYQEQALEMIQALYPGNHPDVAGSLNNVGMAYQTLGESSKGLGYQEQALQMYRALYPGKHPAVANSLNNVGNVYEGLGESSKGLWYQEQALEMIQALYPGNHPAVANSLNNVGVTYEGLGESSKGLWYQEQALEIMQALYPGKHPAVANSLNSVGSAYAKLGESSKGLGYLEQALEMKQALYPGNHPAVANSLNSVGIAYEELGEASKGLGYLEQALEMRQALYPGNHPAVADSLNNVGLAYHTLGESSKGLGYYEQALEMRQALYPGKHPDVANSLNSVGIAYERLGESSKGLWYKEQALEMCRALYPGKHPDVAMSLNNVGSAYHTLGESSKGLWYKEQALEMRQALYPGNHPAVASSLNNVGLAYETLGEAKKGLGYYEQALEMRQALYPGNHPDVADSLNNVGLAYETLGEAKKGLGYQEQALEMRQALYPFNHPDVADSLNNVGLAYETLGEASKGLGYLEQALQMRQALYPSKHPDVANSLNSVGIAYERLGESSKGLWYFEQALEMRQALYPGKHPSVVTSLNNVGLAYDTLGKARKGLGYKEQALEMIQALYPGNHPDVAMSLHNVGTVYNRLGEVSKGLGYFQQALEIRQALYPGNHPDVANSLNNVGIAYERLGEVRKGLGYQGQALEMIQALYPGNHPGVAKSLNKVGLAYHALGEASKGLGYFQQALEMRQALYPGNHPDVATSLDNVGIAYERLGEVSKGLGYLEQALEMRQALYPGNHPDVANSLNNVGAVYERLGEVSKGLGYQEQALEMRQALYPGNHPDVAASLNNVGIAYERLGEYGKAKQHYQEGLRISNKLPDESHSYIHRFTQKLDGLVVNQCYAAANKAYAQHNVAEVIRHYEEALKMLAAASRDTKTSICHNLGCMYHVAALSATEGAVRETCLNKATAAFEQALAWRSDIVKAGLCTEYSNFLLATGQIAQAYPYLLQAIDSGDTQSKLGYGLIEQGIVSPLLQTHIDREGEVVVRGIDYAYYLLLFHYEDFEQAGITLEKTKAEYLAAYEASIRASAGQPGKEKPDEMAYFLLESLQQGLGHELSKEEACRVARRQSAH